MGVLVIKSEPKCKLCQHDRRTDIDALLEKRSNLESDEAGNRINEEYVLRVFGEWGVVNPTPDNIRLHWRRHCQKVKSDVIAKARSVAQELVDEWGRTGLKPVVDVNGDLDVLWAIYMAETKARVESGEKSGITHDLAMKIAAEKTRRAHNESQDKLMEALAGGIQMALGGSPQGALPEAIEDAEYAELPE